MERTRVFRVDGDEVAVSFRRFGGSGPYLGNYPDFLTDPRRTPSGRPWVNVTIEGCPHALHPGNDCGGCAHMKKESPGDLIGVCFHEAHRIAE